MPTTKKISHDNNVCSTLIIAIAYPLVSMNPSLARVVHRLSDPIAPTISSLSLVVEMECHPYPDC